MEHPLEQTVFLQTTDMLKLSAFPCWDIAVLTVRIRKRSHLWFTRMLSPTSRCTWQAFVPTCGKIDVDIYHVVGAGKVFLMYGGCKAAGHTLLCLFVLFCVRTDSDELQSVTVWFWLVFFCFFYAAKKPTCPPQDKSSRSWIYLGLSPGFGCKLSQVRNAKCFRCWCINWVVYNNNNK